jgi:hypothetical protein
MTFTVLVFTMLLMVSTLVVCCVGCLCCCKQEEMAGWLKKACAKAEAEAVALV